MKPNIPSHELSGTPDPHTASLGMLLTMVRSEMVRAIEAELSSKGVDLSFTQYLILKKAQQLGAVSATELARAVELNIPVLNQNRFLYFTGYYEQSAR